MRLFLLSILIVFYKTVSSQDTITINYFLEKQKIKSIYIVRDSFNTSQNQPIRKLDNLYIQLDSIVKDRKTLSYYYSLYPSINKGVIEFFDEKQRIHYCKIKRWTDINEKLNSKIKEYENNGYPFAQFVLDSIYVNNKKLFLHYNLIRNVLIVYDTLDIIGQTSLSKSFLEAYLNIRPNTLYNERINKTIDERINQLNVVKTTKKSELFFIGNKARFRVFLEKKSTNTINGIVGFGQNDQQKFFLTGDVQVFLKNVFRHADEIMVNWKSNERSSQQLQASVQYPYLLNQPVGVQAMFDMHKQDSTYINVALNYGIKFYFSGFNAATIYYEQKQSTIYRSEPSIMFFPYNARYAGFSIGYNKIEDSFLSSKGWKAGFDMAYGLVNFETSSRLPDSLLKSDQRQLRIQGYFLHNILLTKKIFVRYNLRAASISDAYYKNQLYRIGGSQSFRGVDEQSIYADNYVYVSAELRYMLDKQTQLFIFHDRLFYRSLTTTDKPWSIGSGAEMSTKAGTFFVSYALASQFNQPIYFRNAKVHFGYRNNF